MKVKTEKIKIEHEVQVFIADDGKEFRSKSECEFYEEQLRKDELRKVERCWEVHNIPPFDNDVDTDGYTYDWYRPKSEKEIALLEEILSISGRGLNNADIGHWICLDCIDGYTYFSRLDRSIEHVRYVLDELGFDMTVTERKGLVNKNEKD